MKYWIEIFSILVSLFATGAFVYYGGGGLRDRYLDYGVIISVFAASSAVLMLRFQYLADKEFRDLHDKMIFGLRELSDKLNELNALQVREMQNIKNSLSRIIDDTDYIEHVASGGWVHVERVRALEYDIEEMKEMKDNEKSFFYSTYVYSEGWSEDMKDITYKEYFSVLVDVGSKGIDVKRVVISDNGIHDFTPDFKKHIVFLTEHGVNVSVVNRESLYKDKAQNFVVFRNGSEQVGMAYPFIKDPDGRIFKYAVNYKSEVGRGAEWYKEYFDYFMKLYKGGVLMKGFVDSWRNDA